MAQIKVIRMDQSEGESMEVDESLAGVPYHAYIIRDLVVYQQAKARQGTHAVKTRAEITGSTRKVYRQKGTGRARMGNAKAPHRRKGGVAHGPVVRDHAIKINKRVRKSALRSALAEKMRQGQLVVLETLEPETHKTKALAEWPQKMESPRALIVVEDAGNNLKLASSNLAGVELIHHSQLNVYNLLRYPKALMTKAALQAIQERLIG